MNQYQWTLGANVNNTQSSAEQYFCVTAPAANPQIALKWPYAVTELTPTILVEMAHNLPADRLSTLPRIVAKVQSSIKEHLCPNQRVW